MFVQALIEPSGLLSGVLHHEIVTSVFDIGRTGPIVAFDVAPDLVFRSLASFGWGEVTPPGQIMRLALPLVALATLAGCIRLAVTRYDYSPRYIAIVLFLIIGALLWVNAALRILPALIVQPPPFPRYGFPAIGPLALVLAAGWLAWWSPQRRVIGIATLVISLLMLNVLAYATIWWHWYV
jgi:hypothetical protein